MKKRLLLLLLLPLGAWAQTDTENYILTKTYKVPSTVEITEADPTKVSTTLQYVDGLGRRKQTILVDGGNGDVGNNQLFYDWSLGSPTNAGFYNLNGTSSENQIVQGTTPFGDLDLLWECTNTANINADGGWSTDYINRDHTKAYRYTVWVKKTGNRTDGKTYHGTKQVNNLDGSFNSNPYFWTGDLPKIDTWFLLVGYIHPAGYTGPDLGISGVYATDGTKIYDGKEFVWPTSYTTTQYRNYLFNATHTNTKQYFWSPLVQEIDGSELSINEIATSTPAIINNQEILYKDIINHYEYDNFGRQTKEYLPYADNTNGAYSPLAGLKTQEYYQHHYADDFAGITDPTILNPYSEKGFDRSPLNRVVEQAAPGSDWKMGSNFIADNLYTDGHTIKFAYDTNSDDDQIPYFRVSLSVENNTYLPTLETTEITYYQAGDLYKTITKDENWQETDGVNHTTEEFKNKQGQVVLKRTYNNQQPHDTYYVYDNFGNLTYVLPPEVTTTDGVSSVELTELSYQYTYDDRNRLIEKKIPGKGWEYIVYDKLDRPVLTQDVLLREDNNWLFTKYDVLGRVMYTGIYTASASSTRESLQTTFNNKNTSDNYENKVTSGDGFQGSYYTNADFPNTNIELLTINYYDDYVFNRAGAPTSVTNMAGVNSTTNTKTLATGIKVRVLETPHWITTLTYYDTKARPMYVYSKNDYLQTTDIVESKLDDFTGKVLATKTTHKKVGKEDLVTLEKFEYDHMDRLISQTQKINNQITERLVRNNYDDLGQLTSKLTGNATQKGYTDVTSGINISEDIIHKTGASAWNTGLATLGEIQGDGYVEFQTTSTNKWYMAGLSSDNSNASYNTIDFAIYIAGTKLKIYESGQWKQTSGTVAANDVLKVERIGEKIYYKKNDEIIYISLLDATGSFIGDISLHSAGTKIKNFHIVNNHKGLQNVDYTYNVRGWLTNINDIEEIRNDLFTFKINYNKPIEDTPLTEVLYNGNISHTSWKTANDYMKRSYAYRYDALNRITDAFGGTTSNYDVSDIEYDKNGNIVSLTRQGHTNEEATHFGLMDELRYEYDTGNKLRAVDDKSQIPQGFKDGNTTGNDYSYDANGNMVEDKNKGITNIEYNHLNLPTNIKFSGQQSEIKYTYDATGVKLTKDVIDETIDSQTITDYAGNYVYENNTLQFFNTAEGYVKEEAGAYSYVYQIKDHLGNVRMSYINPKGNYQHIFEDSFTQDMGNWVANGSSYPTLENGRLKVTVNSAWEGVRYELPNLNLQDNEQYSIRLKFDKGTTASQIRFYIQEFDANGNHLRYVGLTWQLETGEHRFNYTVGNGAKKIYLRIDKSNTHLSSETQFYIDYVSLSKGELEIIEESNFYPFGLEHRGYNSTVSSNGNSVAQKFTYNGKEIQEELGLNWLDFDARNYQAHIGRFMNIDPMGEFLMSHSPYAYAFNNPVYFDDPTGMLPGINPSQLYNLVEDVNFLIDMSQSNIKLDEVVVAANVDSNHKRPSGPAIYGMGTENYGAGRKGTTTHSINFDDLTPAGGGAKTANALARFLRWIAGLLSTSKNMNEVSEKIAPTKKPNESTMDNKVEEEAKEVPEKIKITLRKHINFNVTKSHKNKIYIQSYMKWPNDTLVYESDLQEVYRKNDSLNDVKKQKAIEKYKKQYKLN